MDSQGIRQEGASYRAIHHLHRVLFLLFLLDGIPQYATCHQHHRGCSDGNTDDLCHHQCLVENQYAYCSHRWRGRRIGILFHGVFLQPAVVALLSLGSGRSSRNSQNDSATTYAISGGYGISDRNRLCYYDYLASVSESTFCKEKSL